MERKQKMFNLREVIPQLLLLFHKRRLNFHFEMIPYTVENLSIKKIANFILAVMNGYIPFSKPLGYPVFAQVEPANFCNLKCPLCLTASENHSRPKALLPFEIFKKFIDELGDYLLLIVLWNWGEPFLNPEIYRMSSYASSRGIKIHCSTNGNVVFDEEKAGKLVNSGMDTLIFGTDGVNQKVYEKYRKGGNIAVVWENIKTILKVRNRSGSKTPRINLRFVVMQHNEHEIPLITEKAKELGVDFLSFKTVDMPIDTGKDLDSQYAPKKESYRRYRYLGETYTRENVNFKCYRPTKRITLDALGEVIPCEYDYRNNHSFGNISGKKSVISIWKGKKAIEFRKKFRYGWNDFYMCKNCTYKGRIQEDCVIKRVALGSLYD